MENSLNWTNRRVDNRNKLIKTRLMNLGEKMAKKPIQTKVKV